MKVSRGFILTKNEEGTYVPFLLRVRERDIIPDGSLSIESNNQIQQVVDNVAANTGNITTLQRNVTGLQTNVSALEKEAKDLKGRVFFAEKYIEDNRTKIAAIDTRLANTNKDLTGLYEYINSNVVLNLNRHSILIDYIKTSAQLCFDKVQNSFNRIQRVVYGKPSPDNSTSSYEGFIDMNGFFHIWGRYKVCEGKHSIKMDGSGFTYRLCGVVEFNAGGFEIDGGLADYNAQPYTWGYNVQLTPLYPGSDTSKYIKCAYTPMSLSSKSFEILVISHSKNFVVNSDYDKEKVVSSSDVYFYATGPDRRFRQEGNKDTISKVPNLALDPLIMAGSELSTVGEVESKYVYDNQSPMTYYPYDYTFKVWEGGTALPTGSNTPYKLTIPASAWRWINLELLFFFSVNNVEYVVPIQLDTKLTAAMIADQEIIEERYYYDEDDTYKLHYLETIIVKGKEVCVDIGIDISNKNVETLLNIKTTRNKTGSVLMMNTVYCKS